MVIASPVGARLGGTVAVPVTPRGASLRFGQRRRWSGLDPDVAPGEFVAVLGPTGSGTTAPLRVLVGLQPLAAGSVLAEGRPPGARAQGTHDCSFTTMEVP